MISTPVFGYELFVAHQYDATATGPGKRKLFTEFRRAQKWVIASNARGRRFESGLRLQMLE
jgi:hypothetical protein